MCKIVFTSVHVTAKLSITFIQLIIYPNYPIINYPLHLNIDMFIHSFIHFSLVAASSCSSDGVSGALSRERRARAGNALWLTVKWIYFKVP